jgi:hypothetical protein
MTFAPLGSVPVWPFPSGTGREEVYETDQAR